MRKFQPVPASRWKKVQPERLPVAKRLLTGTSSLSEADGLAQNSMVNGVATPGLSAALKGTVVCSPRGEPTALRPPPAIGLGWKRTTPLEFVPFPAEPRLPLLTEVVCAPAGSVESSSSEEASAVIAKRQTDDFM